MEIADHSLSTLKINSNNECSSSIVNPRRLLVARSLASERLGSQSASTTNSPKKGRLLLRVWPGLLIAGLVAIII